MGDCKRDQRLVVKYVYLDDTSCMQEISFAYVLSTLMLAESINITYYDIIRSFYDKITLPNTLI